MPMEKKYFYGVTGTKMVKLNLKDNMINIVARLEIGITGMRMPCSHRKVITKMMKNLVNGLTGMRMVK